MCQGSAWDVWGLAMRRAECIRGRLGGTSEQYLGRALRDFAKRDEVVVATKFFPRSAEEIANGVSGKEHILGLLDRSLTNLGMDYIDLYICHMWDYHTPIEEVMEALNTAVTSGKVRSVFPTALHGSSQKQIILRIRTAGPNLFRFRDITICYSARRNARWFRSARIRILH